MDHGTFFSNRRLARRWRELRRLWLNDALFLINSKIVCDFQQFSKIRQKTIIFNLPKCITIRSIRPWGTRG
jgi:hypothetical protein